MDKYSADKQEKMQDLMAIFDHINDQQVAAQYLEDFNWDVEQTVNYFFEQMTQPAPQPVPNLEPKKDETHVIKNELQDQRSYFNQPEPTSTFDKIPSQTNKMLIETENNEMLIETESNDLLDQVSEKPQDKQNEFQEISEITIKNELKDNEILKIIIIGEQGVGKTSIMQRYCEDVFSDSIEPTRGMGLENKTVTKGTKTVDLQFWDTSYINAQHIYLDSIKIFDYAGAILFVYDVNNKESFQNLETAANLVKEAKLNNTVNILVGNKCDLAVQQCISEKELKTFAAKNNMNHLQTSAKNSENIEKVFDSIFSSFKV